MENNMIPLIENVFPKGRNRYARGVHLQLDKGHVDFSKVTEEWMAQNHFLSVPQSPYSPDLASLHFWLLDHLKNSLVGRIFNEPEEFSEEVQPSRFRAVFSH
jgi:transposase